MKTIKNFSETLSITIIKRSLYAIQVLIITMAIPLLSYLELSHDNKPEEVFRKKPAGGCYKK